MSAQLDRRMGSQLPGNGGENSAINGQLPTFHSLINDNTAVFFLKDSGRWARVLLVMQMFALMSNKVAGAISPPLLNSLYIK